MKKMIYGVAGMAAICATSAMAADLPVKAPIYKAPPPAIFSWTGCYLGGNVGGKWARTSGSVDIASATGPAGPSAASSETLGSDTASTVIGGGQLGCNWQTGQVVFGIEGDADAQHWRETRTLAGGLPALFVPGDFFTARSRWQASVRGRLGYTWDRVMLYATGGVAFTDVRVGTNFIAAGLFPASSFEESKTRVGATVGGGLEYAFLNNWSAGVEGRYTWYGSDTFNGGQVATNTLRGLFTVAPVTQTIKLNTAEVMFKLNYHFGGGGPVVARY